MKNWKTTMSYDTEMETAKWLKEIPYLAFKSDWKIQISPPCCGATVRFRVRKDKADISIYLDCYDNLGCYGEPYWEVYPYNGDTYRCGLNETEELLKAIQTSIDEANS